MPSNWLLFDRIRALTRQNRLYTSERLLQDVTTLDKLLTGDTLDFTRNKAILDQTNLQINRLERYKDYEQMDQMGEISLALDLYADEASLIDPERKHTLVIRARNKRLKRELEDLFFNILQWDSQCRPAVRYLCKYGCMPFEIVPDVHRGGVSSLRFISVYNFTRIETRHGDLVGFFHHDPTTQEPQFMHPWQLAHLRLTSFENIFHPYGRSILEGGRKAFKQLRLMEDAALIYRITRAPERLKFSIPIGLIPNKEIPEYMELAARNFKRQRFYNPSTGTFDERYSPLIQEDNYFLPRRPDGVGPDVDVLPGAENLDQIADIEYFLKKVIAPTKIPFARVGIGEGSGEASEKSLSQAHSEFAKAVQWVQRVVSTGLTKVALVHLALRGYNVEDLRGFEIAMSATSAMEELYRIETWQTRVGVMGDLKEIGWFPKEWIVTHFTDLSPDEIEELRDVEDKNSGGGGSLAGLAGGGPGGGPEGDLDLGEPGADGAPPGGVAGEPGAAGGGPEEGDDELPQIPEPGNEAGPGLEGFDARLARKVRGELNQQVISERRAIIRKWAERMGRFTEEEREIESTFVHVLSSNELDGLTTYANPEVIGESAEEPEEIELVGCGVSAEEWDEAYDETYAVVAA